MGITIGDMAEALDQLRKENGLFTCPSKSEILERAILNKKEESLPEKTKDALNVGGEE